MVSARGAVLVTVELRESGGRLSEHRSGQLPLRRRLLPGDRHAHVLLAAPGYQEQQRHSRSIDAVEHVG